MKTYRTLKTFRHMYTGKIHPPGSVLTGPDNWEKIHAGRLELDGAKPTPESPATDDAGADNSFVSVDDPLDPPSIVVADSASNGSPDGAIFVGVDDPLDPPGVTDGPAVPADGPIQPAAPRKKRKGMTDDTPSAV